MQFDIESTIQDNVRLKKALQMTKFSFDKLQKQHNQLKTLHDQLIERNRQIKNDYCDLQRKYQHSFSQSLKQNNALISQIEELKKLIDEKQRDMDQLQIKLIPNLDQDMLRVKLITEMQGPYQQTVQKKDKQIDRLKNKISELQRNLQIMGLSLKSKVDEIKKERDYIKDKYEEQTNRLMKELNLALSRNQIQSIQSSIIKNQRKQIQQLKTTVEFTLSNQQKYLGEIKELKYQRNQLLQKMMQLSGKEAFLLQSKHNLSELQRIKEEKLKLSQEIDKIKILNEKQARQITKLEQQKGKLQTNLQQQIHDYKNRLSTERNQHSNQLYELKEEIKRLKNFKIQNQADKTQVYQKLRYMEKQLYQKTRELQTLRLQNSRYTQRGIQPGCWDGFCKGDSRYKFKENDITIHNQQKKRQKIFDHDNSDKYKKKYQQAQKYIQKLKIKLEQANKKILQLIKDKMKYGKNISPQRDRTQSVFQKPIGVFLQYQDCGLKPIVQPTLYTYGNTKKV